MTTPTPTPQLTAEQLEELPRIARETCSLPAGEARERHLNSHHPLLPSRLPTLSRMICEASSRFDIARLELLVRTASKMQTGDLETREGHVAAGAIIFGDSPPSIFSPSQTPHTWTPPSPT